jgi:Tol biopolymer transport system component
MKMKSIQTFAAVSMLLAIFANGALAQSTARIVFTAPVSIQISTKPARYTTYDQIFAMNPDGSGVTQLTSAAANSEVPAWSPGQQYVAFVRDPGKLMVMRADGSGGFVIATNAVGGGASSIDWSADGSALIYTAGNKNNDIYAVPVNPAAGTAGAPVFFAAGPSYDPNCSPDGTKVAFDRYPANGGSSSIIVHDLASGAEYNFSSLISAPNSWGPSWSPNSVMLAFQADATVTVKTKKGTTTSTVAGVFIANADGSGLYQVTPSSISGNLPTWSPDGASLAFVDGGIYTTVIGSGLFTFLSNGTSVDWNP